MSPAGWRRILLFFVFCSSLLTTANAAPPVDKLLKTADSIRNPADSFSMKVRVTNQDDEEVSEFEVSLKGNNKTLIKTLRPARDQGRNLLMLDENMWAYLPNLKRSIRISLSQRLTGQAANGDIARTRWYGDYSGELEKETGTEFQILLKAQKENLTYDQIRVWIRKKSGAADRAEYLTKTGKVLKKVQYLNFKKIAGGLRPTEIRIQDSTKANRVSTIWIESMTPKSFADSVFNQNNLGE